MTPPTMEPDDEDIVDMPGGQGGLPKVVVVLGVIALLFGVLAFGGRSWYQRQVDPPGPPGEPVAVEIPSGAALTDLGGLLDGPGIVANGTLFRFWIRDKDIDLQAGRYEFRRNSSFEEVAEVLRAGPIEVATEVITIAEGLRIDQIVEHIDEEIDRFSADDIRAAIADPANRSPLLPAEPVAPEGIPPMEGMLFPSTYEVGPNDTAASLVRRMVDEMVRQTSAAGVGDGLPGDNLPPLSPYEILVVASLIERETGGPNESDRIARVIYNRLLVGPEHDIFALEIDATNQYEADVTGRPVDFESPSPYNSRDGLELPPTPIAAPGRASIDAAMSPAPNPVEGPPLLYYVLEAPGQHVFTGDYDEFLEARRACQEQGLC